MVVALVYFGLALNSENLNGNLYLNFGLAGIVEIPAYLLVIVLVDRFGRRRLYSIWMIIGGLACLSTILPIEYEPEGKGSYFSFLNFSLTHFRGTYVHKCFPTDNAKKIFGIYTWVPFIMAYRILNNFAGRNKFT